ncbi:MAG: 3-hydroxyacyl-ACP dehydratase, partial [Deltaproteobacteria bacterium]|nr:3-hydroxyacyl-ACP dehydratase [Deltaproteobacteria bacterium]
MRTAGIDIGSRSIELVVLNGDGIVQTRQTESGFDPMDRAQALLDGIQYDRILATGYGRHWFETALDAPTVTEIKAYAAGAYALLPGVRTVLDIGGQDSKAIAVGDQGRVTRFEMNDRCAAGTGKFLEIMARTLGFELEEFGRQALNGNNDLQISNMCTVFAESEVTSLLARGKDRNDIALALHRSVVRRAAGMLNRVCGEEPIVFAGGVAKNICMRRLLEHKLQKKIYVPKDPEMVGAYGAALLAHGWVYCQ